MLSEPPARNPLRTRKLLPSPRLLSGLGDGSIVGFAVHEEPDCQQPVQLGPDPRKETEREGKPPGWLFIQYEPLRTQFQA